MNTSPESKKMGLGLTFWMALGSLLMGLFDTWLFVILGLEFSFAGKDATIIMAIFLTVTFGLFGFFWGKALTAGRREKKAAAQRRHALLELAEVQGRVAHMEKMAALGQVAASIAHEVRNPLAIIRSQVQNLGEDLDMNLSPDPEDLHIILQEIDRLSRVVEEIGHFSRPIQPRMLPILSADIVHRVSFMVGALYKDRETAALDVCSHTPVGLTSDPDLLCQALMTLIINAVEVSPKQQVVILSLAQTPDQLQFHINDGGPGIPDHLHQTVVEPFYTTKPGGTGLGLAIAQDIAQALGGNMQIGEGALGGAQLSFCVPLQPGSTAIPKTTFTAEQV